MQVLDVEQGSWDWHCERQGFVTGTRIKSALGTPAVQKTLMFQLIAERMTEPQISDLSTKAVQRGQELEPIARAAVSKETGIIFEEVGMLVCDEIPGFRLSPDAICRDDDGEIVGGLEIKCPDSKKHVEYAINNEIPKEYAPQVYAPFLLSDQIEWWLFASFDDRNYELPLFLHMAFRFETVQADREKLSAFLDLVDEKHQQLTF